MQKFCLESDLKSDQIWIAYNVNPEFDYMNSNKSFGHNSLYTGPNDLNLVPLESLDIGLQFS